MGEIKARTARVDDREAWHGLWEQYQAFQGITLPPEVSALTWQRLLDAGEPMFAAVAEQEGRLLGFSHYVEHRSFWTRGDYCYIQDIFTAPEHRRRGVARMLLNYVFTSAEGRGCSRVYWLAHEDNAAARELYDRLVGHSGFIHYRKQLPGF